MKNNNMKSVLLLVLLTISIVLGVVLINQNQDTRKGAYFGKTAVLLKPTELTKALGQILPIEVWVVSEGEAKVDGVEAYVCYGDKLKPVNVEDLEESVVPNQDKKFNVVTKAVMVDDNKCILFQVGSMGTATDKLPFGAFKAATINLKAMSVGSGRVNIDQARTKISGRNTDTGSIDTALQITSVEGMNFTITEADVEPTSGTQPTATAGPTNPPSADDMWVNYKVTYAGVKKDRACAVSWPTKLTVLSGSTKKDYVDVPLTRTSEVNSKGEAIYQGSLQLAGFKQSANVALFFKGPKHLQVKYGKSDQVAIYNQAGGEISLTNNKDTSPVLDLTAYPMLAGDIDSNGIIDGVDFASVKLKAASFSQVNDGGYIAEDLDGSCQVNNSDIILLVRSLNEKQDQVY